MFIVFLLTVITVTEIESKVFPDKWAAFEWMYKNQLGRRNLTDQQRAYMIGKMYEARKHTESFKGNQHTVISGGAENLPNQPKKRTAVIIGDEIGVSHDTVKKSEKFAKGVDALREVNPDAADKIFLSVIFWTRSIREISLKFP